MHSRVLRTGVSLAALALVVAPAAVSAQSRQVRAPNVSTADGATQVTIGGTTFTNQGIVGAGRLDANTRDFRDETLGSFSGMALDLTQWRRNPDGSYNGFMVTLPDRGPMDGAIDYRNRVHTSDIGFRPLTGGGTLPQSPSSQSQLRITPTGGFTLKDAGGVEMTGRDPGASTVTRSGITYPLATDGTAANLVRLDSEAIAFLPDGSFYVSDEYAAGLYYFDPSGRQIGAIQTVGALLPRTAGGVIDMNSVSPGAGGRRNNQGLEAMAVTPDNKKLVTILQSATVQDTNGSQQQTRNNTRILVYDISSNPTPTTPVGHYVLQLPVFNNNGSGGNPDRTAAQSEMLALNDTQFLVLARDGLGRGVAAGASTSETPVFKSVLLVDTAGATNLAGTPYETGNTPIASNGTLNAGIVPVQQVELVNLLNTAQLAKVGMNLTRLPLTSSTSIGEKWEAMALAPVLDENAPQDFFLFIGNDNDFQGTSTSFNGTDYASGALDGTGNNDSVLLVYRLTLPTYADPQALAALHTTPQAALYGARIALDDLAGNATQPAMRTLNAQRSLSDGEHPRPRVNLWLEGDNSVTKGVAMLDEADIRGLGLTGGLDFALGSAVRLGAFGGYRELDGETRPGDPFDASSWHVGLYGAVEVAGGLYVEAAGTWFGDISLDKIARSSAYGQQAEGRTSGDGWQASGEAGWQIPLGNATLTPFAAADYADPELDGYVEHGASVSNIAFPDRELKKLTVSLGGELAARMGIVRPALRAGYAFEDESGDESATVKLASLQHAMGTTTVDLAKTESNGLFGELRIAAGEGPLSAWFSGRGRWGDGNTDLRASITVAYGF
jgi:outer membrane autotransporter protein